MEITLKQVETLRDRAGVSEAEAREALERNGGDLLDPEHGGVSAEDCH